MVVERTLVSDALVQFPQQRLMFRPFQMLQELVVGDHLLAFSLFGLEAGSELCVERVLENRFLEVIDGVSDGGFAHLPILVRHFEGATNQFICVNDLEWFGRCAINSLINRRADDSMIVFGIIVSPIISTEIGSRGIVSGANLRAEQDFSGFSVKDGVG